jgi:hypothetical protein
MYQPHLYILFIHRQSSQLLTWKGKRDPKFEPINRETWQRAHISEIPAASEEPTGYFCTAGVRWSWDCTSSQSARPILQKGHHNIEMRRNFFWIPFSDFWTPLLLFLNTPALISEDDCSGFRSELFPMIPMRVHRAHGLPSAISPGMPRFQQSKKFDLSRASWTAQSEQIALC